MQWESPLVPCKSTWQFLLALFQLRSGKIIECLENPQRVDKATGTMKPVQGTDMAMTNGIENVCLGNLHRWGLFSALVC